MRRNRKIDRLIDAANTEFNPEWAAARNLNDNRQHRPGEGLNKGLGSQMALKPKDTQGGKFSKAAVKRRLAKGGYDGPAAKGATKKRLDAVGRDKK